jgi:hypothetical protein
MTPECGQIREKFSEYLDGELPEADQVALESHLRGCPECRRELKLLERTIRAVAELPARRPRPGFSQRVIEQIRGEPAAPAADKVIRLWTRALPVAAMFFIVIGLTFLVSSQGLFRGAAKGERLARVPAGAGEAVTGRLGAEVAEAEKEEASPELPAGSMVLNGLLPERGEPTDPDSKALLGLDALGEERGGEGGRLLRSPDHYAEETEAVPEAKARDMEVSVLGDVRPELRGRRTTGEGAWTPQEGAARERAPEDANAPAETEAITEKLHLREAPATLLEPKPTTEQLAVLKTHGPVEGAKAALEKLDAGETDAAGGLTPRDVLTIETDEPTRLALRVAQLAYGRGAVLVPDRGDREARSQTAVKDDAERHAATEIRITVPPERYELLLKELTDLTTTAPADERRALTRYSAPGPDGAPLRGGRTRAAVPAPGQAPEPATEAPPTVTAERAHDVGAGWRMIDEDRLKETAWVTLLVRIVPPAPAVQPAAVPTPPPPAP